MRESGMSAQAGEGDGMSDKRDLTAELREGADWLVAMSFGSHVAECARAAADEIERLRAVLRQISGMSATTPAVAIRELATDALHGGLAAGAHAVSAAMIERVAQAIGCVTGGERCWSDEMQHPKKCPSCLAAAERAIAAIREPTQAMVDAGNSAVDGGAGGSVTTWRAMINAALMEKPDAPR